MPYTITFYPEDTEASAVKSKQYETLSELLDKELGDGEVDEEIAEQIAYGSYSFGIGYDAEGKIIDIEGSGIPDCSRKRVEALDGEVCFYFGYPPAFIIEDVE